MAKLTALLDWSLYVDCSREQEEQHIGAVRLACHIGNSLDHLADWKVTFEYSDHKFMLAGVSY